MANYIEPFAGSLAVLLARPTTPRVETVNDLDCYLANFWRALAADPQEVAKWADWPVNEADLNARHRWLVGQEEFRERMRSDPVYYDAKIAGWWAWGLSQWIGGGWCDLESAAPKLPRLDGFGGAGIAGPSVVNLQNWFVALQARLIRVRVACGDWSRVLKPAVLRSVGVTAILLDPPYAEGDFVYAGAKRGETNKTAALFADVKVWALEHGHDPALRIALCGYEGEHALAGWDCVAWKANGGYSNQNKDKSNKNKYRERIWFSPHCLKTKQGKLL